MNREIAWRVMSLWVGPRPPVTITNGALPAENAGGLAETISDLTNNLGELTEPVPVVGDVVDAVGNVIESTLVGDNNGGLNGILTGLTDGLTRHIRTATAGGRCLEPAKYDNPGFHQRR